ncbi:MAG: hypothetical protein WC712_09585 [Candidatus Brocadiia bacterium]
MKAIKIAALVLIAAGVLGLIFTSFTYTSDTHSTTVGPVKVSVDDKEKVNIPMWGCIGAIAVGAVTLALTFALGGKKS